MNRESRIADMVIHGWEPVHAGPKYGIANRDLGIGFACVWGGTDSRKIYKLVAWVEVATWDDITDEILDMIEARLSET